MDEAAEFPAFGDAAAMLAGRVCVLLGWRPDDFWRATPAELIAVLKAFAPPARGGVSRADLARLEALFPDGPSAEKPGVSTWMR